MHAVSPFDTSANSVQTVKKYHVCISYMSGVARPATSEGYVRTTRLYYEHAAEYSSIDIYSRDIHAQVFLAYLYRTAVNIRRHKSLRLRLVLCQPTT